MARLRRRSRIGRCRRAGMLSALLAPTRCPPPAPFCPRALVPLTTVVWQVFYVNTVTNAAQKEFPEESALPAGWDIVVSSTGEEYYMNMDTGQRSYELPMADVEDGGALTPFLFLFL